MIAQTLVDILAHQVQMKPVPCPQKGNRGNQSPHRLYQWPVNLACILAKESAQSYYHLAKPEYLSTD